MNSHCAVGSLNGEGVFSTCAVLGYSISHVQVFAGSVSRLSASRLNVLARCERTSRTTHCRQWPGDLKPIQTDRHAIAVHYKPHQT